MKSCALEAERLCQRGGRICLELNEYFQKSSVTKTLTTKSRVTRGPSPPPMPYTTAQGHGEPDRKPAIEPTAKLVDFTSRIKPARRDSAEFVKEAPRTGLLLELEAEAKTDPRLLAGLLRPPGIHLMKLSCPQDAPFTGDRGWKSQAD